MLESEVRKGSVEVLILGALEERARHGYEIARFIESRSDGGITFHFATLYPTLRSAHGWFRRPVQAGSCHVRGLALCALLLVLVGVYAVAAAYVAERRQEIGIRGALGANRRDLIRLVLAEGLQTRVLVAVAAALPAAIRAAGADPLVAMRAE